MTDLKLGDSIGNAANQLVAYACLAPTAYWFLGQLNLILLLQFQVKKDIHPRNGIDLRDVAFSAVQV